MLDALGRYQFGVPQPHLIPTGSAGFYARNTGEILSEIIDIYSRFRFSHCNGVKRDIALNGRHILGYDFTALAQHVIPVFYARVIPGRRVKARKTPAVNLTSGIIFFSLEQIVCDNGSLTCVFPRFVRHEDIACVIRIGDHQFGIKAKFLPEITMGTIVKAMTQYSADCICSDIQHVGNVIGLIQNMLFELRTSGIEIGISDTFAVNEHFIYAGRGGVKAGGFNRFGNIEFLPQHGRRIYIPEGLKGSGFPSCGVYAVTDRSSQKVCAARIIEIVREHRFSVSAYYKIIDAVGRSEGAESNPSQVKCRKRPGIA